MLKNFKRLLSLILILALIIPNMVFADGLNGESTFVEQQETKEISKDEMLKRIQELVKQEGMAEDLVEDYNPEEIVRIIVELNEKPVIVHATESGQRYEDMSYSQKSNIESSIYAAQEAVKNQISARNIDMNFARSFNTVFSGFSGEVRFEDIETIENIKGVKKVYISNEYERPEIEPNMSSSNDMIGSKDLWAPEIGYMGEGMVVAIIDTGIDPSHKDFKLTDDGKARLKQADIPSDLLGTYFTPKVPYGYNYYDLNTTILDLGPDASEHGMHVAGTVTANGEIKGVAPESQVLAMKVFSNDPVYATTFDDIYLVAIEDAIKLKADVLNMSLGSTASFYVAQSAVDTAITNATDHGIVCSISAGNSGYTQHGWSDGTSKTNYGLPFKQDPDYGLVGAPSLSKDSISVASIENVSISASYLEYSIPGVAEVLPRFSVIIEDEAYARELVMVRNSPAQRKYINAKNNNIPVFVKLGETIFNDGNGNRLQDLNILPKVVTYTDKDGNVSQMAVREGGTTGEGKTVQAPMAKAGSITLSDVFKEKVEFVDCGIGAPADFTGKDLTGKIALIIRGALNFTAKIENAQAAGAAGVIVYNNADGGNELINMAYPPAGKIPAGFIGYTYGTELLELKDKFIKFPSGVISTPNVNGGQMSDFSSWGTTPTLELKPEITAPGGQIYSTLQNNKYGIMSGTSMAAPHLSGGAALVMQYIKKDAKFAGLSQEKQTRLSKVLLMNTAGIVMEEVDDDVFAPYSPRKQGAGLMNLKAAVTTPVRVVSANGEAKVELKDFDSKTFTMNLKAINHSKEELTYNVNVDVLADEIYAELGLNLLSSRIVDANVTGDKTVTIPANGEKTFTVTVDISGDKDIYENMFVEGFVKLTESTDTHPELSVPFVGFYGDWDEPRILDAMKGETDTYYDFSGMIDTGEYFMGGTMAISPGTDDGEFYETDTITPVLSFLRNAEKVEYNILDKDDNKVRTIRTENLVRKNYIDGGTGPHYSYVPARVWDGTAKNKVVEDGLYKYQIKAKVQNGEWQERLVPLFVDTKAPVVSNVAYNNETGKLTWTATDETSGVLVIFVDINGKSAGTIDVKGDKTEFELDIKAKMDELLKVEGDNKIVISALDNALNTGESSITVSVDNEIPYIYLLEPELLEIYDTKDIIFKGYVLKNNEIKSVKVDGQEAVVKFSKEIKHLEGTADEVIVPGYTFEYKLTDLPNGLHTIKVEAESLAGKKIDIVRRFFVDTTMPELAVNVKARDAVSATAELDITMKDNFSSLLLYVFDSEEYNENMAENEYDIIKPSTETITVKVDLEIGGNLIPIKLIDAAGNEFTKTINVLREEPSDAKAVELDKAALEIKYAKGDSATSVTKDLILPLLGEYDSEITWESSNVDVITNDGKITRPIEDTTVTLTATITKGVVDDTKTFTVTVKKGISKIALEDKIAEVKALVEDDYLSGWTKLQAELTVAQEVVDNATATQVEIDEALDNLTAAMEALVINPLIGDVTVAYGDFPAGAEGKQYVAYVLFNLKAAFKDAVVEVKLDGTGLEKKDGIVGSDFRFEGLVSEVPTEVVIIIDGVSYTVSGKSEITPMSQQEIIELIGNIEN